MEESPDTGEVAEQPTSSLTPQQARAVLKDWLCFACDTTRGYPHQLARAAEITPRRFAQLRSPRRNEVPTPLELERLAVAAAYPAHALAQEASRLLCPVEPLRSLREADEVPPGEMVIASAAELKAWIRRARGTRRAGKLSQKGLADLIGAAAVTMHLWENPHKPVLPSRPVLQRIAQVCGVPIPEVTIQLRKTRHDLHRKLVTAPLADTLAEEILWTGRVLASHTAGAGLAERNAEMFQARYGGTGDSESTLQMIGDRFAMTRERVRQIVEKQLGFLGVVTPRQERFEALVEACSSMPPLPVVEAESHLRQWLGHGLSLRGAQEYGVEVLGRKLPIHWIERANAEPFVVAGERPDWFDSAVTNCKKLIRHSGAAQFTLAWALSQRDSPERIDPAEYRRVIANVPGFEWVDDEHRWFWFGVEGSANRMLQRASEILLAAERPLDIEIIYGGLARYSRTQNSDIADDAGVFPPMEIVRLLLTRAPGFQCQQGDDFRLIDPPEREARSQVVQQLLVALRERGGVASRSELAEELVNRNGVNIITFSVMLAIAPVIRQVDRGVFAIRGWPIPATRLAQAQRATTSGWPASIEVEHLDGGGICWFGVLTDSALTNRAASLPARAMPHVLSGEYLLPDGRSLHVVLDASPRVRGLVRAVREAGGKSGTRFKVTLWPINRVAEVTIDTVDRVETLGGAR